MKTRNDYIMSAYNSLGITVIFCVVSALACLGHMFASGVSGVNAAGIVLSYAVFRLTDVIENMGNALEIDLTKKPQG